MTITPSLPAVRTAALPASGGVPVRRAEAAMPAKAAYVREARHFVERLLALWGVAEADRDSAVLVVGELAANAAVHGRHTMTVGLALDGPVLRIVVADHGDPALPASGAGDGRAEEECGRGLAIVDCLAASVQIRQGPWGREVRVAMGIESA
ncbi:ATP-binding protein [Kitasatospora sp. McL0602]|uniref:ATP-binding protein n=1 Tax=Kitasatospora sp. McL0602 TaxID=3439530 RepID=UPI003F8AFE9C